MARHLQRLGHAVGRWRVGLMAKMGLMPICQRPRASEPHPEHRIYPLPAARHRDHESKPGLVRRKRT
jgi:hypothetical protein